MAIISPEQSQSQIWNPHFTLSLLREFMTLVVFNSFFLIFFTLVIKISPSKSPSNSTHVCNVTSILLNLSIYPCNLEHYFYCFWFSIHKSTYDFVGIDCEAQLSCCIQSMEVLWFFFSCSKEHPYTNTARTPGIPIPHGRMFGVHPFMVHDNDSVKTQLHITLELIIYTW